MSDKIFDDGCGCVAGSGSLCANCVNRLYVDWGELKASRDELLRFIKDWKTGKVSLWCEEGTETIKRVNELIQKAEQQKEKEPK